MAGFDIDLDELLARLRKDLHDPEGGGAAIVPEDDPDFDTIPAITRLKLDVENVRTLETSLPPLLARLRRGEAATAADVTDLEVVADLLGRTLADLEKNLDGYKMLYILLQQKSALLDSILNRAEDEMDEDLDDTDDEDDELEDDDFGDDDGDDDDDELAN
jgi:hypothetical protein